MSVPLRSRSAPLASAWDAYPAGARVADVVACDWVGRPGRRRRLRMLPDGCADLLWDGSRLTVAGAHAGPVDHSVGAQTAVGLRLRPGVAGPLFEVPAAELPAAGVDLSTLLGGSADRWCERLAEAATERGRLTVLEALIAARMDAGHLPDGLVTAAVRELAAPGRTVDDAGRAVGLSARELRRRFTDDIGHGPKLVQRILRFRRLSGAVDRLASRTVTLGRIAADLGYADQAHLTRECRVFAGVSPREMIATWTRHARPDPSV